MLRHLTPWMLRRLNESPAGGVALPTPHVRSITECRPRLDDHSEALTGFDLASTLARSVPFPTLREFFCSIVCRVFDSRGPFGAASSSPMERLLHASHAHSLARRCHLRLVRTFDRMHDGQLSRWLPATSPAVLEVLGEGREGSQSARVESTDFNRSRATLVIEHFMFGNHRLDRRSRFSGLQHEPLRSGER